MRRLAWILLLFMAFTIPWEYSLVFSAPFGDIARLTGIALLLTMIPAAFLQGTVRRWCPILSLTAALCLWSCISFFWSIDQASTLIRVRAYAQETMIVWFVWEIVDSPEELRDLLRASVAGPWVLALLTIANFLFSQSAEQIRFVASGQDPNDVARYLNLALPLAALLFTVERRWMPRIIAAGYLPVGLGAVLLTASRSGLVGAIIAVLGAISILSDKSLHRAANAVGALAAAAIGFWVILPSETLERLRTIPEQISRGDLNQRLDIWHAGWTAFAQAPFFGQGAGAFVTAAHLAAEDTAHNTALALGVEGGIVSLSLGVGIVLFAVRAIWDVPRHLRIALGTSLAIWLVSSMTATVQESRSTWILIGFIAVVGRLATDAPGSLGAIFSSLRHDYRSIDHLQPSESEQ